MQRPIIIAGNWKMHKTVVEALDFIEALAPEAQKSLCEVLLAVPFTAIKALSSIAQECGIAVGAQNMSDQHEGALTGEISAEMLKEAGASFVLLGHSERRAHFGETDAYIHQKLRRAISERLPAILCIGESENERNLGHSIEALKKQIEGCLGDLKVEELEKVIIAYEPVWAIGTGKTATPEVAQTTHAEIREHLRKNWGQKWADSVCLIYGGSVKPSNIDDLIVQPDIDGALIGGASLDVKVFSQMVQR